MAEIVINANDRRIQYTATLNQTVFAYDFPIYVNTHISVIRNRAGTLTTRTLTTHYTVSGVGAEAGGNITMTAGNESLAGDVVTLVASTPYERTSDYGVGGDFAAATVNKDFDWITMLAQQNNRDASRSLALHIADTSTPLKFDIATTASRQSKLLEVDATGTLVQANRDLADFDLDVAAAAASAAAAAVSETNAAASEAAAATSESNAAASETAAAASASSASTSATNAATSATTASTQATNAATSATNAATSATTASTQATNAATSASSAATSATNAANSATAASGSATAADASADAAAISESAAAASAAAASASEGAAAASAASAASSAAAGLYQNVVAKTFADSPIVPLVSEDGTLFLVDTSGGNVVVNLSALATYGEDMKLAFVKTTADANTITVNRGGTNTINGNTSATLANQYEVTVFVGDSATGVWITAVQAAGLTDGSVTFAKLQNIATDSLIGRDTAGTGVPESITVGGGIEFTGAGALRIAAYTGDVTKTAGGTALTIAANAVTNAKFRQGAALSVVGVTGNATADVADITAGTDHQVLRRSGTALAFGAVNLAQAAAVTGTLDETNGGTGLATYTQGDILYASAANTLSALAKDTNATRYLSNTGSSNNPAWAQVALATGVSGQLPLANGGTGANLTDPNADRVLFWDDSAGAMTWLTMGTNLTITGTTLNAAAASAGLTQIATSTPGAVASIDFASIAATYNDLVLHWSGVSCATTLRQFLVKPSIAGVFGGTNIYKKIINTTTVTAEEAQIAFLHAGINQLSANTAQGVLIIHDYASTTNYKRFTAYTVKDVGGSSVYTLVEGIFMSTSAIDGLRMYWGNGTSDAESAVNFDAGTFTLYGRI